MHESLSVILTPVPVPMVQTGFKQFSTSDILKKIVMIWTVWGEVVLASVLECANTAYSFKAG